MTCNWLVNICLIKYFSFYHRYGLVGIWAGKTLSDMLISLCYHSMIENNDWEQLSLKVSARICKFKGKKSKSSVPKVQQLEPGKSLELNQRSKS